MSKMSKTIAVLGVVAGLGVAALPLSTYAATGPETDPENVQLNVTVSNEIELAVKAGSETVNINAVNGAAVTGQEGNATLVVKTAATGGYTLYAKTADVNLKDATLPTANTIAAGVPTTGTSAWGMKYGGADAASGQFNTYKALTTNNQIVRATSAVMADTTAGDETTVTFGVTASASQAAGVYTGSATFTAAANI